MNDLLVGVLDAHGGVDRWAGVHTITAHLSIGGPFWRRKRWPEIFGEQTTLELDTRREHIVVTPFTDLDRRSVFDVNPARMQGPGRFKGRVPLWLSRHFIARATRPRAVLARVADVRFPQPPRDEHGWIPPR
jgi:hypothetical protein